MFDKRQLSALAGAAIGLALAAFAPGRALASCNVIPGVRQAFLAQKGTVDRPFGVDGEWISISPDCSETGYGPFSGVGTDFVVSVAFVHEDGGAHLIAITDDCDAINAQGHACAGDNFDCVPASTPAGSLLEVKERDGQGTLRFEFPDTDKYLGSDADSISLAGPARIAVTKKGEPLACAIVENDCSQTTGLTACIDRLYANGGGCERVPGPFFANFTALPEPNQYHRLCVEPNPPCLADEDELLRFVPDAEGNLLIPMKWDGVLVPVDDEEEDRQSLPFARLLKAQMYLKAFAGEGNDDNVVAPSRDFLHSFSFEGSLLPPVFEPHVDPSLLQNLSLFGTADAPATVLMIKRRSPSFQQCDGGARDGQACARPEDCVGGSCGKARCAGGSNQDEQCSSDAGCPGSECGPSLFSLVDRRLDGMGPVVVGRILNGATPQVAAGACQTGGQLVGSCTSTAECAAGTCVAFSFTADHPVALDGIAQGSSANSFVVSEGLDLQDLNGDQDTRDEVVLLSDRNTGESTPIGIGDFPARAVSRLHPDTFSFPAVAAEGDLVVFLEPEALQSKCDTAQGCDQNQDGDAFDTLLRVYRIGNGEAESLIGDDTAIDASPVIDGRSVALSDGLLFYRQPEWAGLGYQATCVSCTAAQCFSNNSCAESDDDCTEADCTGDEPSMSGDGRYLTYTDADHTGWRIDLRTGNRRIVSRGLADQILRVSDDASQSMTVDTTGNFVVFTSKLDGILLRDVAACASQRVDVSPAGAAANGTSTAATVSTGGRFVAFESTATNLLSGGDSNAALKDVFVRDMQLEADPQHATVVVSVSSNGTQGQPNSFGTTRGSFGAFLSADGRYVSFSSDAAGLVATNPNCTPVVRAYVHDRDADMDGVFDETAPGATSTVLAEGSKQQECGSLAWSLDTSVSSGRAGVGFRSGQSGLVPGDTNDQFDLFLRSFGSSQLRRLNLTSAGEEVPGGTSSTFPVVSVANSGFLSRDGRFAAFEQTCCALGTGMPTVFAGQSVYVKDTLTGLTRRMDEISTGQVASQALAPVISQNGAIVAFEGQFAASFLDPRCQLPNSERDGSHAVVMRPKSTSSTQDLDKDGDVLDTVLQVRDLSEDGANSVSLLPATIVSVLARRAAFLVPEAELTKADGTGTKLNPDNDATDDVVHFYDHDVGGTANLARAATDVAMGRTHLVALVSEAAEGGIDLNGDGDTIDTVLQTWGPIGAGAWASSHRAADAFAFAGSIVFLAVPEASQGAADLNGDGDSTDRIAHIYLPGSALPEKIHNAEVPSGVAILDFVAGDRLIAMRVSEEAQNQNLNTDPGDPVHSDDDLDDDVLFIYDTETGRLINTRQSVVPCALEACDRRQPYRVLDSTVRFLTVESHQGKGDEDGKGRDLNDDGDKKDLVVQIFNVDLANEEEEMSFRGAVRDVSRTVRGTATVFSGAVTTASSVSAGVCSDTGDGCSNNADCGPPATCFVPPGRCVENTGAQCVPPLEDDSDSGCPAKQFCRPLPNNLTQGTCFKVELQEDGNTPVTCQTTSQCSAGDCEDASAGVQRIAHALLSDLGDMIFISAGECMEETDEPCASIKQCGFGQRCRDGFCEIPHGSCAVTDDCPPTSLCKPNAVLATASDSDGDEVPDPFDNCPYQINPKQTDQFGDGVGDACRLSCGDGFVVFPEECDDGSTTHTSGEFCRGSCLVGRCGQPVNFAMARPKASDALYTLRAGVGAVSCDGRICDVNKSGAVSAPDALLVLRKSVGQSARMNCPR